MNKKLDNQKLKLGAAILLWSALASYYGQPLIHGNQDAVNIIVTMFSILAGFLVAIITLVGDPKSLPSGGWQKAQLGSELTYVRLNRHKLLFKLYLLTLAFVFISMLLKNKLSDYQAIFEHIYLFLACSAFLISFKLPASLMQLQQERIEHEINERRANEGIKDDK